MNQPFPPQHPGQWQPPAGQGARPPAMPGTYLPHPSAQRHPGPNRPMPTRPVHGPYGPMTPPMPGVPAPRPSVDGRIPGGRPRPAPQWNGQQGNGYGPGDTAPGLLLRPLPGPQPGPQPARRSKKWIGWVVAILLLGGLGAAGYFFVARTAPAAAAVGDCVAERGTNDVGVVPCGDPTAAFRVVGRLENRTMIDAGLFACSPFPETTSSYWQGKEGVGELGLVLCLAPVA